MISLLNRIWKIVMVLLVALCVLLLVLKSFGVYVICVNGNSMMPTIQDGQLFIATKIDPNEIRRGDVVTAKLETSDGTTLITKRVIGLPGEEICIGFSTIWANGDWVQEPYLEWPGWNDFGEFDSSFTLGPDEFYLMGDDREKSWSGVVKKDDILMRVVGK